MKIEEGLRETLTLAEVAQLTWKKIRVEKTFCHDCSSLIFQLLQVPTEHLALLNVGSVFLYTLT
jgi:hypothetical protein